MTMRCQTCGLDEDVELPGCWLCAGRQLRLVVAGSFVHLRRVVGGSIQASGFRSAVEALQWASVEGFSVMADPEVVTPPG